LKGHARAIEETAREHPAKTAALGLAALGLLAALVFARR